jgi:simple sugar transport system ATP-binding protein
VLDGGNLPPVVETSGLTKRFGTTVALDDVSVAVAAGQTHALVGRNGAGKSTLVALITGLYAPDSGEIRFHGESAPPLSRPERWRGLVACVYQRSTVIGSLSVAENLFLNPDHRFISWGAMRRRARAVLEPLGVDVDPATMASELSVEQRQFVEIARAVSRGARFVVLDEPTAQLDAEAITRLFRKIREMQAAGVTFLYISHHLQEIFDICQTVTVLRDARHIVTAPVSTMTTRDLVDAMTGASSSRASHAARVVLADDEVEPVLAIDGLSRTGEFEEVTLAVKPHEIVGLAGIGGSGIVSVAETVVGLRRPTAGTIRTRRGAVTGRGVFQALDRGVAFVPEDRHDEGLVSTMSVADNVTLAVLPTLGRNGWVSPRRRRDVATQAIDELDIKVATIDDSVTALSGGNQQKVVYARALATRPDVLVLIRPTSGVDVRSKESLLDATEGAAAERAGVLLVSDELDDLRSCDRVVVMFRGRVAATHHRGWTDAELVASMEGVADD